jgi:uncharacterized metal-binding protein YceD (DUF177 family)
VDCAAANLEFSRLFDIGEVPAEGLAVTLRATTEECRALARRFGLEQLHALEAAISIVPARDAVGAPALRLQATFQAEVTQTCVVTLEPFSDRVADGFSILFRFAADSAQEEDDDLAGEEDIETLEGREIDLGELVAQHLALALDPHPRAPGAVFQGGGAGAAAANSAIEADGPFAILGQLKHKM